MAEDIREELYELRERNDREIQALESVRPEPVEREGSDGRGVVTVRVGPEGQVRDVRVAHDWRTSTDEAALPGAIIDALTRAQAGAAEEFLTGVEELEGRELPPARPMPMPQDSGEVFGRTEPVTPAEAERIIGDLWAEVEQAMASMEASLDGFNARTGSARSADGEVVVEIGAGGEVTRLDLEPRWLARAHAANIGRLVTATLHEAQSSVLEGLTDVADTVRSAQEAMQRVGDPYTLSRRFGLTP
ncbi:YbaB/EbfC family nucleoid-associated protein [Phycicoccus avicenniae]|uniref:YbaB/EbfC family nucleoid-associated protein n=1 Tax=Phycicoccus avicenniae TaxID=2828860 RepID=UPI003D2C76B0